MKRRTALILAISSGAACALAAIAVWHRQPDPQVFTPARDVTVSFFPATDGVVHQPLVIAGSSDISTLVPYIRAFQSANGGTAIAYLRSSGAALLDRALQACRAEERTADLYLSSSIDHLLLLANENCALKLGTDVDETSPPSAQWRGEVLAFTAEPAVFVYSRHALADAEVPRSHVELINWLRQPGRPKGRIGTFDIEVSGSGYNFAADDARQSTMYGRILESLGRAGTRSYCCSLAMIDALDRGEIDFAYNVQMSYAYAAQRSGSRVGVIVPRDYVAVQNRSVMIPKGARDPAAGRNFARFLVSPSGRAISRTQLMEPSVPKERAEVKAEGLLDQVAVSPVLLKLQDRALRERMIREWHQAVPSVRPTVSETLLEN